MTYSIIARCPHTGRFGVGSTTFSMACGRRNESVRPNVGVSKSQAFYLRYVDPLALNMLAQGYTPQHIMRTLEADDPDFDYRQFGIIDRENNVVAHTGPGCGKWAGHTVGPYYAAYGNGLAGPQTVAGIISGFLKQPDAPLEDRLLLALEGGRDAGGQMSKGVPRPGALGVDTRRRSARSSGNRRARRSARQDRRRTAPRPRGIQTLPRLLQRALRPSGRGDSRRGVCRRLDAKAA